MNFFEEAQVVFQNPGIQSEIYVAFEHRMLCCSYQLLRKLGLSS